MMRNLLGMCWRLLVALALVAFGLEGLASAAAVASLRAPVAAALGSDDTPVVPHQLIVKFRPDVGAKAPQGLELGFATLLQSPASASLDALVAKHRVLQMKRVFRNPTSAAKRTADARRRYPVRATRVPAGTPVPDLDDIYLLQLEDGADLRQALADFAASESVVYAQPNYVYRTQLALPDLPFVPDDRYITQDGSTWSEGAWGQSFPDLWGLESAKAIEGWNIFDENDDGIFSGGELAPGEGVVVAVIDSGLDTGHVDIAGNVWSNPDEVLNGSDDDGNGLIDDLNGWDFVEDDALPNDDCGHGTHVAGTIAAIVDNTSGVAGLAPFAKVMPVKGLDANGRGNSADLAAAVEYATDKGAAVLSNSWGGYSPDEVVKTAFAYAHGQGVISVAAAGNANARVGSTHFPAGFPHVITVAAVDHESHRAWFSDYGLRIDVSAAGVEVLSLNANGGSNTLAGDYPERVVDTDYLWLNGTSMACPHAAAAAAVLVSRYPTESVEEIRGRLMAGAQSIDTLNPGFENALGAGMVDLEESLLASPRPVVRVGPVRIAGDLMRGGDVEITVRLRNFWQDASQVSAALSTGSPYAAVLDGNASFGDLPLGAEQHNDADPFVVTIDPATPMGERIDFALDLAGGEGYADQVHFWVDKVPFQDVTELAGLPAIDDVPWDLRFHDYDSDGFADVCYDGFFLYALYRNSTDGRFVDVSEDLGADLPDFWVWAHLMIDIDNDGYRDLFLGGDLPDGSRLLHNQGGGVFEDISTASGASSHLAMELLAFDYNEDGFGDILAGGYSAQEPASLLRNNGDATFTDVITGTGLPRSLPYDYQQSFDYDNDGDVDILILAYDNTPRLYRNSGDQHYTDVTLSAFDIPRPSESTAAAVGDYDNDGYIDIFFSGFDQAITQALYRNDGDGTFSDVTAAAGDLATSEGESFSSGTDFFDYDNDGDLDLYVQQVVTLPEEPDLTNALFRNDGGGVFTYVNDSVFPGHVVPSEAAAAIADYDNDGALDIYAPSSAFAVTGGGALLKNWIGTLNHWVEVDLVGNLSNRNAYGARVSVTTEGLTQIREVHTSPVQATPLHFGLADREVIDEMAVRWPSGRRQRLLEVAADQRLSVVEPLVECEYDLDANGDGVCDELLSLFGTAEGGSVSLTLEGVLITVSTAPGESATEVLTALAAAILSDPQLAALGIYAVVEDFLLVTNGAIDSVSIADPGLSTDLLPVPALATWWWRLGFLGALLLAGMLWLGHRHIRAS